MNNWIVCHFIKENTVEVVPDFWFLRNYRKCYWPPQNLKRISAELIKRREEPDSQKWELFDAKELGCYEDLATARRKAKKAEEDSELSSTSNDVRISKVNKRFINSSSNSENSDQESYPIIPRNAFKGVSKSNVKRKEQLLSRTQENSTAPQTTNTCDVKKGEANGFDLEFQRQVLRQLNIIKATLSQQSEILDVLLKSKNTEVCSPANNETLNEILSKFPLIDLKDLQNVEDMLANDIPDDLSKELSRIGGSSINEVTKKIMYRFLSSELGQSFSWDGAKGKKPFKLLKSAQVIIKAVCLNPKTKDASEVEIINVVKSWLVRAKDRVQNQNKKYRNNTQHATEEV